MKKVIRFLLRIIFALVIFVFIWSLFNFSLISYGFDQLKGQLHILMNARPLKEVLDDKLVPDSLKQKIYFIESVKKFAIDSLGLKPSENYNTLYDQGSKPLLWVITASEPYKIKAYEWKFPLLGNVSYKGFFDYVKGKQEELSLKEKGYDTDYGVVSAWSTLGWFHDPVLSGMLNKKEGQLAELIIHELTHSTLYLKSNVNINENLASVSGEQGAIRFLKSFYGVNSKELKDYVNRKEDYDRFINQMLAGAHLLDSLYTCIKDSNVVVKKKSKDEMIKAIINSLDTVSFLIPGLYKNIFKREKPNNAYFLDFIRYDARKEEMKKELIEKFHGNLRAFIEDLRQKQK